MHLRNKQTIVKTVNAPNCHCEERSDVAISQYPVESWESPGENATAFPRLHPKGASSRSGRHVGRWPPRNDKSENLAPLNLCHDHCRSAWRSLSAATDAIGRCVFIDTLHELEVPSRDCHVALLLAMTHQVVRRCTSALLPLNGSVQGGHYPQGARRIRKAAKPPTAAQGAPLQSNLAARAVGDGLYGLQLPPRDCHVASLLAMTI